MMVRKKQDALNNYSNLEATIKNEVSMYESFSTMALSKLVDSLVFKIALYSALDQIRMKELEIELKEVQSLLVVRMSNENDVWLACTSFEA